jgi:hypothetical protein
VPIGETFCLIYKREFEACPYPFLFIFIKSMAFGLWKKIKAGIGKVISGIGKVGKWIHDKVLKPVASVAKPILSVAAPLIDKVKPGLGTGLQMGAEFLAPKDASQNTVLGQVPQGETLVGGGGRGVQVPSGGVRSDTDQLLPRIRPGQGGRGVYRGPNLG